MTGRRRKIIVEVGIIIAFTMVIVLGIYLSNRPISAEKAKAIAVICVRKANVYAEETNTTGCWEWDIVVNRVEPLYSPKETIEAYYVELRDGQDRNSGYVIVGANRWQSPIIEMSIVSAFLPAKVRYEEKGSKIYCLGGIDYWVECEKGMVSAGHACHKDVVSKDVFKTYHVRRSDHWEEWKQYKKQLRMFDTQLTDNIISEPSDREKYVEYLFGEE